MRNLIFSALFVALIAIGAFVRITLPYIPFTLQTLFVILAGLLLGPKGSFITVCCYLLLGLVGIPIFAQGGGLSYIFKPSFGYLIGFAFGSALSGFLSRGKEPGIKKLMVANFSGMLVIYAFGLVYFYLITLLYLKQPIALGALLVHGFLLTIPSDILVCIIAAFLGKRLIPLYRKWN